MGPGPERSYQGFGVEYKKKNQGTYPANVDISGYGEGLPFEHNYVEN